MTNDYEKQIKAAMGIVDINVKAMNTIMEKQSALMKEILAKTMSNMQEMQNTTFQSPEIEANMKKGMEIQTKIGEAVNENINILRKAGQDITNLLSEGTAAPAPKQSKPSSK